MAQLSKILTLLFILLLIFTSLLSSQCAGKRPSQIHRGSLGRKSMMRRRFYDEQQLRVREFQGAVLGESERAIPSGPDPIHHRIRLHN